MKIYSILKENGSIQIMGIGDDNSTVEQEIDKWAFQKKQMVSSVSEIQKSDIPVDRYFREAWVSGDKPIDIDMNKARNIHMDRIRRARDEKLKALDVETLKGNDVHAQKQVLRDIPQTFDLTIATTPEELKALWPEILT
jgi:hypothetical protein